MLVSHLQTEGTGNKTKLTGPPYSPKEHTYGDEGKG